MNAKFCAHDITNLKDSLTDLILQGKNKVSFMISSISRDVLALETWGSRKKKRRSSPTFK